MKREQNMKKSIIGFLLVVLLLVSLFPTAAFAQTVQGEGYTFNTVTGELHIGNDAGSTAWRNDANIAKEAVKSVSFQRLDTPVINIGDSAFEGCVNLSGIIKLNADATSIGKDAFKGCGKIDTIMIPEAAKDDIADAGISENVPYMVYQFDMNAQHGFLFIQEVHYGNKTQLSFDGNIYDGTYSCSMHVACKDDFNVTLDWWTLGYFYKEETDGTITVTKLAGVNAYREFTLFSKVGDLVVKEYADSAFANTSFYSDSLLIVQEGVKANVPAEVSKVVCKTENGKKVGYFTPGTSAVLEDILDSMHVPDIEVLYVKDIVLKNSPGLSHYTIVSYEEDENGDIIVTNVTMGRFFFEDFVMPSTIEGKPVKTVMINSEHNYGMEGIKVDESVNKIIYKPDTQGTTEAYVIEKIVQGTDQESVELPATIDGKALAAVPETAFDESVETVVVPQGMSVSQPDTVCKIEYTTDNNGNITITKITPAKDAQGADKQVTIPETIGGKEPAVADDVKDAMAEIAHGHVGGKATCNKKAVCIACDMEYGELGDHEELTAHAEVKATCTKAGNIAYWECTVCGQKFSDAEGNEKTTGEATVIPVTDHHFVGGKCSVCGADDEFEPVITDGANGVYRNEDSGLTFRSDADFDDFICVLVDGKEVDDQNYTVREGSTIVTLKAEYLKTLAGGEHTIAIVSDSGTASAKFTVAKDADVCVNHTPDTGDNNQIGLWISLLIVAAGGLLSCAIMFKNKEYNR